MKKIPNRFLNTLIAGVLISGFGIAYATINYSEYFPNGSTVLQSESNGWTTPTNGASKEIMSPEGCRKVTSTQGQMMFVPTGAMSNWTSFRDNLPNGVSIGDCIPPGLCQKVHIGWGEIAGNGVNSSFVSSQSALITQTYKIEQYGSEYGGLLGTRDCNNTFAFCDASRTSNSTYYEVMGASMISFKVRLNPYVNVSDSRMTFLVATSNSFDEGFSKFAFCTPGTTRPSTLAEINTFGDNLDLWGRARYFYDGYQTIDGWSNGIGVAYGATPTSELANELFGTNVLFSGIHQKCIRSASTDSSCIISNAITDNGITSCISRTISIGSDGIIDLTCSNF